jgi:hypothetical protein
VLDRHYTVLSEFDQGTDLLVVTSEWTESSASAPRRWPRRSEVAPMAWHWQTLLEDPDEDPEYRSYTQLYAETLPWHSGVVDALLRAVAERRTVKRHPRADRSAVAVPPVPKARHHDWLSKQQSGL